MKNTAALQYILAVVIAAVLSSPVISLGYGGTVAVGYGSATVCGVVARGKKHRIECFVEGRAVQLKPDISFSAIVGGRGSSFCALRSGGGSFICWDKEFRPKRVYMNNSRPLEEISMGGDGRICGLRQGSGKVECWRGGSPGEMYRFASVTSGSGYSCGILEENYRVYCWGSSPMGEEIARQFGDMAMITLVAGVDHVCGMSAEMGLVCRGDNSSGQLQPPSGLGIEFSGILALGKNHSCALNNWNGSVVCWGEGVYLTPDISAVSFVSITSGMDFTCGLTARNFSVICWGRGWPYDEEHVGISTVLPGPCVSSSCNPCGVYPDSQSLCSRADENICTPCLGPPPPHAPPPSPPTGSSSPRSKILFLFGIVGSVGCLTGAAAIVYCVWRAISRRKKRIHDSVQPTISYPGGPSASRRLRQRNGRSHSPGRWSGSRRLRGILRQRSGTSSVKGAEEFTLQELAAATGGFSAENRIGSGSFGVVYRGKLADGREVAIKRGETNPKAKKFQEKETAFRSEISFLSRLHHKHLVKLVGYCEEEQERLLVYEYMKNGALFDHLHGDKNKGKKTMSPLNSSWRMRIRVALDACRGVEYLHSYAVPPIIHRDIKSSNILLDNKWTARVSDFGLSLMWPEEEVEEEEDENKGMRPVKAAGTVGYMDPEYYGMNVLTAKSDVYGMGVVLLELVTGRRAVFKDEGEEGTPMSLVDYAVGAIMEGRVKEVADERVGLMEGREGEAVELMAYTAMVCVRMEGKERPVMGDVVSNLEKALLLCDGVVGDSSLSSSVATISIVSD